MSYACLLTTLSSTPPLPRQPILSITSGLRFLGDPSRTSGSTGTEISGSDILGKRPLHRLIDIAASELESYQKGCRKLQGWKPAKSRSFLQRFGRSERISFLIEKLADALHLG